MVLCKYGYDAEKGHTTYSVVKCECGEIEAKQVDDKIVCVSCGRERNDE